MTATAGDERRAGIAGAVERLTSAWALVGGLVLLAVIAVNMLAVIGAAIGRSFPGDFELTEMGVAIAVFAFLPYCQIREVNVTADIFTAGAGPRWLAAFKALAALVATGFAAILLWRMSAGMADQRDYGYATAILQLPIWYAFVPILVSLALLAAAALVSLSEALRALRGARHV
ncbi:TRAP transporter small permease subunit [Palleronia sediminis]|uniref:TRAP transporter small permease protein n=1 Tax=Palleronia sediminis TaxID=2547833 RepID=A0A4R6AD32_9RHOB|nr:TRAP transporter small permease subunit [Palleronia sediminis]TDL81087.1 TRAP transporter small permease subunit [Palleronia sediminis]